MLCRSRKYKLASEWILDKLFSLCLLNNLWSFSVCCWVIDSFCTMLKINLTSILIISSVIAAFPCCLNRIKGFIYFFHFKSRFVQGILFFAYNLILKFQWETRLFGVGFLGGDASACFSDLPQWTVVNINNSASVISSLSFALGFCELQLTSENPVHVHLTCFTFLISNDCICFWIKNLDM